MERNCPVNVKLRDELLSLEIFDALQEAKVLIECWRRILGVKKLDIY